MEQDVVVQKFMVHFFFLSEKLLDDKTAVALNCQKK